MTTEDMQLRSLDQDGTGGTVFYDPAYMPTVEPIADTTPIIYPKVIDTIAVQQQPIAEYIPEDCIDCETQPELVPNPYPIDPIATNEDAAVTEPTKTKITDWIKANPLVAVAGGAGLFLLLNDKKKKKVGATKKNKSLLLAGAAAVGVYFLIKKNQQSQIPTEPVIDTTTDIPVIDPAITEPAELPVTTQSDPYAYPEIDRSYYDQMWRLLSNNYLYQEHPYDYPFAGEVLKEYKYIVDGHPTSSQWNVGVPGAFMVMLDRWYRYYLTDSKKKIFEPVLFQIGNLYKAYLNQISTL